MIDGLRREHPKGDAAPGGDASSTGGPRAPWRRGFGFGAALVRLGVTADQVTVVGVVLAGLTGVVLATGHLWTGVVLVTVGGLMDTLDGVVAKAAGTASKRGAFFDSVADRVADAAIFGGVAWYLASSAHPHLAVLPFAILGMSTVVSYARAKGELLGFDAKGGLMERAERLILLGVALAFNVVLVPLLWVLLALTTLTAAQRFLKVWRQATVELAGGPAARAGSTWRPGRVESRWRTWRQQPRAARPRRREAVPSRVRARRRTVPLGTRLRTVLAAERTPSGRRVLVASRRRSGRGTRLGHRSGDR